MLRRNHIGSDRFVGQEVDNMYCVVLYDSIKDLSDMVKKKIPEEDAKRLEGRTLFPIKIDINRSDLTVEAIFMADLISDTDDKISAD